MGTYRIFIMRFGTKKVRSEFKPSESSVKGHNLKPLEAQNGDKSLKRTSSFLFSSTTSDVTVDKDTFEDLFETLAAVVETQSKLVNISQENTRRRTLSEIHEVTNPTLTC